LITKVDVIADDTGNEAAFWQELNFHGKSLIKGSRILLYGWANAGDGWGATA